MDQSLGGVLPWVFPHARLWALLGISITLAGAVFALRLEYADKITADGTVRRSVEPIVIRSPEAGRVTTVRVSQNHDVDVGDPLVVVDKQVLGSHGLARSRLQIDQLQARKRSLREANARYVDMRQRSKKVLEHGIEGASAQVRTLFEQLDILRQGEALAVENLRKVQRLALEHWLSEGDAMRSRSAVLAAKDARLRTQRELQIARTQAQELRASLLLHSAESDYRGAQYVDDLQQVEHEIEQAIAAQKTVIAAPTAARVVDVVVSVGEQVASGAALMTLVPPSEAQHEVELLLPSVAAGRIRPGMPVRLRYSGYPYQDFGAGTGRVMRVSEARHSQYSAPVFRADIAVEQLPERIDHAPAGMLVSADVVLQSQPLWAWLVRPLLSMAQRL